MKAPTWLIVVVCLMGVCLIVAVSALYRISLVQRDDAANPAIIPGSQGKFEKLMIDLHNRGDTNTALRTSELVAEILAEQKATDAIMQITLLEHLRSGRTNEAIRLLETLLDGSLMTLGMTNDAQRFDNILKRAREYRAKHPYKSGHPDIDKAVERALNPAPN